MLVVKLLLWCTLNNIGENFNNVIVIKQEDNNNKIEDIDRIDFGNGQEALSYNSWQQSKNERR